eukprot:270253_1
METSTPTIIEPQLQETEGRTTTTTTTTTTTPKSIFTPISKINCSKYRFDNIPGGCQKIICVWLCLLTSLLWIPLMLGTHSTDFDHIISKCMYDRTIKSNCSKSRENESWTYCAGIEAKHFYLNINNNSNCPLVSNGGRICFCGNGDPDYNNEDIAPQYADGIWHKCWIFDCDDFTFSNPKNRENTMNPFLIASVVIAGITLLLCFYVGFGLISKIRNDGN